MIIFLIKIMKENYLFKIILLSFLLLEIKTEELNTSNSNKIIIDLTKIEDTERESHSIVLTDSNFDSIIQNGNQNRWMILFYTENCGFCKQLKSLLNKIIEEKKFKDINNLKFGSIDVNYNLRLQTRFEIKNIPILILVENNKMLQISNVPIEESLIKAIEIEDISAIEHAKDIPPELSLYLFLKNLFINSLDIIKNFVNQILNTYKIKYNFTIKSFFISLVCICFLFTALFFYLITSCCCKESTPKKEVKKEENKESENKINEIKDKEKKKDDDNGYNGDHKDNEEGKKIIEEKKEKEMKEKINEEKKNINKEQPKKKEKKKKKE